MFKGQFGSYHFMYVSVLAFCIVPCCYKSEFVTKLSQIIVFKEEVKKNPHFYKVYPKCFHLKKLKLN